MGAGGEDLLVLHEEPQARAAPAATPASTTSRCCYPTARSWPARSRAWPITRTPIEGASDHGISEAIYLPDPDGNGIELAADRPRDAWPDPAGTAGPHPLDLHGAARDASPARSRRATPTPG